MWSWGQTAQRCEETCTPNVPCVTLGDNTERPETLEVGPNILTGTHSSRILECSKEWEHDIKYVSDLILKYLGKDDSRVIYKRAETCATRVKHMDFSKAQKET